MVHHRNLTLTNIHPSETAALAAHLTLPPHLLSMNSPTTGSPCPIWLTHSAYTTLQLPATLRAPTGLGGRLSLALDRQLHRHHVARLCDAHGGLNPWLVRRAARLLEGEVTRRLRALRVWLGEDDDGKGLRYHSEVAEREDMAALVARLVSAAGLWLDEEEFERRFRGAGRRARVRSGCEACVLAAVGGDHGAVRDLLAAVRGRTHSRKGRRRPELAGLVEAWGRQLGERDMGECERLGRMVRRARRAVWRERHGEREVDDGGKHGRRKHTNSRGDTRRLRSASISGGGGRDVSRDDSGYGSALASQAGGVPLCVGHHRHSSLRQRRPLSHYDNDENGVHGLPLEQDCQSAHSTRDSANTRRHRPSAVNTVDAILNAYETSVDDSSSDEDEHEDEDEPVTPGVLNRRASDWYDDMHARLLDDQAVHSALRGLDITDEKQKHERGTRHATVMTMELSRETLGLHNRRGHADEDERDDDDEEYDASKWTDVSLRLVDTESDDWNELPKRARTLLSSSSVYSTEGPGVPHPPLSSSNISSPTTPRLIFSAAEEKEKEGPGDMFATLRRRQSGSSSVASSQRTVRNSGAGRSRKTPTSMTQSGVDVVSAAEFQGRLDRLSLEGAGEVLPGHSVSVAGGRRAVSRSSPRVSLRSRGVVAEEDEEDMARDVGVMSVLESLESENESVPLLSRDGAAGTQEETWYVTGKEKERKYFGKP